MFVFRLSVLVYIHGSAFVDYCMSDNPPVVSHIWLVRR
jgi:hypothetical protein